MQMSDPEPIALFQEIVGVGRLSTQQPKPSENGTPRKLMYRWEISRRSEVAQVLRLLIDSGYMSSRRLEQMNKVLNFVNERMLANV